MATLRQTSKTITVGTSATTFDPAVDLGTNAQTLHRFIRVKNRSVTAEIGVHDAGTASINGDDVVHIAAGESEIFDVAVLSVISSAAGTPVEFCGDKGRLR